MGIEACLWVVADQSAHDGIGWYTVLFDEAFDDVEGAFGAVADEGEGDGGDLLGCGQRLAMFVADHELLRCTFFLFARHAGFCSRGLVEEGIVR